MTTAIVCICHIGWPKHFNPVDINVTECSLSLTAYEYTNAKSSGSAFFFEQTREVDLVAKNAWHGAWDGHQAYVSGNEGIPALYMSRHDLKALQTFTESASIVSEWVGGNWHNQNLGVSAALHGNGHAGNRFDSLAGPRHD
ncbi:hypothetical protein QQS21_002111 [Conoideocrella luteorostrata]|uniref:Uncharacterized protein n=1 Tax=Conoideocrella luteorostrata TaxID=1105319 RepID=A0AAJ0CVT2_9HYPO|nr:hypothetical protein QQS21_002111 [Conoideocrella luteorostrata]